MCSTAMVEGKRPITGWRPRQQAWTCSWRLLACLVLAAASPSSFAAALPPSTTA